MRPAPAILRLALGLALAAGAAGAETPMTATEFEAYVNGRTIHYAGQGQEAYGAEQYLPNRRVIWTFLDGECVEGLWYEEGGLICFVYELDLMPQCWSFWRSGGGITARFENEPAATALYELSQTDEPLICQGPDLGV
ncbi:MAG: hypothetical protein OEM24_09030 [Paracoccaceae bacterium]|nr:hypothetical protein [Paracoccaceae bacterium]